MSGFYDWPVERQEDALLEMAIHALQEYDGEFREPQIVKYRENAIFRVEQKGGEQFALRIHRHDYHSEAALVSELSWMEALQANNFPVPTIVHNRNQDSLTRVSSPNIPERRHVDLLSWLDGAPLGKLEEKGTLSREERRGHYAKLGALCARLHTHACNWTPPPNFARPNWFANALVGEAPIWGRYWEMDSLSREQRALVIRARECGTSALQRIHQTPENSGLIHADLIADNVMVNGSQLQLLDFDDAGHGWHMFDIATTIYFTMHDPDHAGLREAVLAGYRSVRSLAAQDEATLPLFLMLRGMTYLGWVESRSETPTAKELTPELIDRCCQAAEAFLAQ